MRTRKTMIALKIRGGRLARELWALAKILGGLFLLLALLASVKVALCKRDAPKTAALDCLAPPRRFAK